MTDQTKDAIDISAEACAVACMLVSNPQGALRKDGDGWQKRVNDLIRALRAELDRLRKPIETGEVAEVVAYIRAQDGWMSTVTRGPNPTSFSTDYDEQAPYKAADLLDRLARENERLRDGLARAVEKKDKLHLARMPAIEDVTLEGERLVDRLKAAEARAERLAEALRYMVQVREIKCEHKHPPPDDFCAKCKADTALATLSPKAEEK